MHTEDELYAERLVTAGAQRWKQALRVQAPYEWNLRRQNLGRTLDVGCGVGRNLGQLAAGSIGIDHNPTSVRVAQSRGFSAMTTESFLKSELAAPEAFDGLLLSHVVEHLPPHDGRQLLAQYLPFLKPGGRVFFVCPQERGFASDPTHVRWTTARDLERLANEVGLLVLKSRSFPFPRIAGRFFTYNEFNVAAVKPTESAGSVNDTAL